MTTAVVPSESVGELVVRQQKPVTSPMVSMLTTAFYDRVADPMDFVKNMGAIFFDSGMFGCSSIAQGRALAYIFFVRKIDPLDWVNRHHIIKGKITLSAEAMIADFRAKANGKHRIITRTPDEAAVELQLGKEKRLFSFTWKEAQGEDYVWDKEAVKNPKLRFLPNGQPNEQYLKNNWNTPRRRMQMLWARVVSDAVGAMAPEVSMGYLCPEELDEIQEDVVDAEFTVKTSEPSEPVEEPPFEDNAAAVASPATEAVVTDTPAAPTVVASAEPTAEYKTEPSPVPPPSEADIAARREQIVNERREALLAIKDLKENKLKIPDASWSQAMAKRGVAKATDLDDGQLFALRDDLAHRWEAKQAKANQDPVAAWANAQLERKNR